MSTFAPNCYLFQANAAALSLRLRRPHDVMYTEGSACLTGIGGIAKAECHNLFSMHGGLLGADSYRTEVTGDFVDRKAASELTNSHPPAVSTWETNRLAITTSTECTVNGFHSKNFDSSARIDGPSLRIGQFDFRMEGANSREGKAEELSIQFKRLSFSSVFINGMELKVTVERGLFNDCPTFAAFKEKFQSGAFPEKFAPMVYSPTGPGGKLLHDPRGFCTVSVVSKIQWKDPKKGDPRMIDGHSIKVPGYGTIYLGEMTISPLQRRLHMVRVELGCPDGGSGGGGLGCLGGHDRP